jgi:hypothetical protein
MTSDTDAGVYFRPGAGLHRPGLRCQDLGCRCRPLRPRNY